MADDINKLMFDTAAQLTLAAFDKLTLPSEQLGKPSYMAETISEMFTTIYEALLELPEIEEYEEGET